MVDAPKGRRKQRLPAAVELFVLMNEDSEVAKRVRARFDRSWLWKLAKGERRELLVSKALELQEESEGRIAVGGWVMPRTHRGPESTRGQGSTGRLSGKPIDSARLRSPGKRTVLVSRGSEGLK
jgi:hypothetical protein